MTKRELEKLSKSQLIAYIQPLQVIIAQQQDLIQSQSELIATQNAQMIVEQTNMIGKILSEFASEPPSQTVVADSDTIKYVQKLLDETKDMTGEPPDEEN